ncbi:MAG: arylesterase [Pseudomonadota bacterium]
MHLVRERFSSLSYGAVRAVSNLCAALILLASAASAETVIAALGDSLTQGFGLPPEQGFVSQLQGWLDENGADVRLINAGVSGDTTAGGLARIGWTLSDEVDGLIVALGGNDVLRGIAPEEARSNLDGILKAAADQDLPVLLVGISAPGNYGPEYKTSFEAIYPRLASEHGALLYPDFLAAISSDTARALAEWMQADSIHPNGTGVARIVEAIGPRVLKLIEAAETR